MDAISEVAKEPAEVGGVHDLGVDISRHAQMLRACEGIAVYNKRKNTRRIIVLERAGLEDLTERL